MKNKIIFGFNFEIFHEIQMLFLCFYLFARGCNYINRKLHDVPLKVGLKILNQNLYLLLFLSKKWFDKKYLILFLLANHFLHLCSNINVKIFLKIGVEYYSIKQKKIYHKKCVNFHQKVRKFLHILRQCWQNRSF